VSRDTEEVSIEFFQVQLDFFFYGTCGARRDPMCRVGVAMSVDMFEAFEIGLKACGSGH